MCNFLYIRTLTRYTGLKTCVFQFAFGKLAAVETVYHSTHTLDVLLRERVLSPILQINFHHTDFHSALQRYRALRNLEISAPNKNSNDQPQQTLCF